MNIDPALFDVVIFDMDGVVTDTTAAHTAAWKEVFDDFLLRRIGADVELFDQTAEYLEFVDGKPRHDGVRSFLESRGISLAEGTPDDPSSTDTVYGLGTRKNEAFLARLARDGADSYPSTLHLVDELHEADIRVGLITSSRNASVVLKASDVGAVFDVIIDGKAAAERGLPGKPSPAVFLAAAGDMGGTAARAVVVEDAIAGVAGGSAGGFGLVIGVARHGNRSALLTAGAHVVVEDLAEVSVGSEYSSLL